MTKNVSLICVCWAALSACSYAHKAVPTADIPFAEADYTLGEETTAEVCNAYVFMIAWGKLFGRDTAVHTGGAGMSLPIVGALMGSKPSPEASEALYEALDGAHGATHLLAPLVKTTFVGLGTSSVPMFGSRCGHVRARTVTIGAPRYTGGVTLNPPPPAPPSRSTPLKPVEIYEEPPPPTQRSIEEGEVLQP